jgi:hypothetical protein
MLMAPSMAHGRVIWVQVVMGQRSKTGYCGFELTVGEEDKGFSSLVLRLTPLQALMCGKDEVQVCSRSQWWTSSAGHHSQCSLLVMLSMLMPHAHVEH